MDTFKVGTHCFTMDAEKGYVLPDLSQYAPFRTDVGEPLFHLAVTDDSVSTADYREICCFNEEPPFIRVYEGTNGHYLFEFMPLEKDKPAGFLELPEDFQTGLLHTVTSVLSDRLFSINNALMLLYTFNTARRDTLMMHASVTRHEGYGNLFLGKSGTGKSTHSQLWTRYIPGCDLMNDDNPVVQVLDGTVVVFGTPWSGKTPCYRNVQAPVRAFVRIVQAPSDHIYRMPVLEAYTALRMSSSCMKWSRPMSDGINCTIEKILKLVPCYHLDCLPDKEAALLCCRTVEQNEV